jgi:hypothetical protein
MGGLMIFLVVGIGLIAYALIDEHKLPALRTKGEVVGKRHYISEANRGRTMYVIEMTIPEEPYRVTMHTDSERHQQIAYHQSLPIRVTHSRLNHWWLVEEDQ